MTFVSCSLDLKVPERWISHPLTNFNFYSNEDKSTGRHQAKRRIFLISYYAGICHIITDLNEEKDTHH